MRALGVVCSLVVVAKNRYTQLVTLETVMTNKELLVKRFEANKMANYAESLRLEGLQSKPELSKLNPKVIEKIKQISSSQ